MDAHNRVMLVDDEASVRTSWNRFLSGRGFEVATTRDGGQAISELVSNPADVVVSDLKMPGVDGMMLLEWLREKQPETRFILLTGYGSEEIEKRARELGAYEYLNKPISPDELAAVVTAAMHLDLAEVEDAPSRPTLDTARAAASEVLGQIGLRSEEAEATPRETRGKLRSALELTAMVIAAPLLGLAFVIFLPVIGFVTMFWYLGAAFFGIFKEPESTGA